MNYWIDIACIVFFCVTVNHLGLVKAIEDTFHRELKVANCQKCLTWWSSIVYSIVTLREPIPSLAISILASYIALWLELFEGFIDSLYTKLYEKIYPDSADDTDSEDPDSGHSAGSVPELQQNCKNDT